MTPAQHAEISNQVNDLLEKGLIQRSLSPCVVPYVLSPKKYGKWRLCTNSMSMKKITVRYRFPMPRIEDLLDQLGGACYFTKIDLKSRYHQIRIKLGDEWKIVFKTNKGLFDWLAMPFGLSNAPSTFMRLKIEIFIEFIRNFFVLYLDDMLIFIHSKEEHLDHVE